MPAAKIDKLQMFYNLDFSENKAAGNQAIGDCLFCGKTNKFYINKETLQWDCKVCGERGNEHNFLQKIYDYYHITNYASAPWDDLSTAKLIPVDVLQLSDLIWDGTRWLIAYRDMKGKVVSLSEYMTKTQPPKIWVLKGLGKHLYGLHKITKEIKTVYICESEWDAVVLNQELDLETEVAVATSSANVFKDDWPLYFQNKEIILCYDNDKAGFAGRNKAYTLLKGIAASIEFVDWPKWIDDGYDVRDWFAKDKRSWDDFNNLFKVYVPEKEEEVTRIWSGTPPTFEQTLDVFKQYLEITPAGEAGIRFALAVQLSVNIPGDPLWGFLVGPPGSMKTEVLHSLRGCLKTYFLSSCTPASLVSGAHASPDPSILRKADGKCLVFKDWTEVLTKSKDEAASIDSIFRGAYDGTVEREYGQGKINRFNTRFAFLAGVTPVIRSTNNSTMGERSILFNIYTGRGNDDRKMVEAAYKGGGNEVEMRQEIQDAVTEYIERTILPDSEIEIPDKYDDEIIALAMMVARLRAIVLRDIRDPEKLSLLPFFEVGTRLVKTFKKLAQALALHEDNKIVNERVMSILRKCAKDTCNELHLYMVYALCKIGKPGTKPDLLEASKIPHSTAGRVLEDLGLLGIIEKKGSITIATKGSIATWGLNQNAEEWAKAAGLYPTNSITNGHSPKTESKNPKPTKTKFRVKF